MKVILNTHYSLKDAENYVNNMIEGDAKVRDVKMSATHNASRGRHCYHTMIILDE